MLELYFSDDKHSNSRSSIKSSSARGVDKPCKDSSYWPPEARHETVDCKQFVFIFIMCIYIY